MKVSVQSVLKCPPEFVWDMVQTSALFFEVVRPVLAVKPLPGSLFPPRWQEGESVSCRVYLFGWLPLGRHTIRFDRIDQQRRQIQTKESGRLIRRFRHRIEVSRAAGGSALYSDEVELDYGPLTPLAGLVLRYFFRHRHRRWKTLIGGARPALAAAMAVGSSGG
jgi:hypothetical protein